MLLEERVHDFPVILGLVDFGQSKVCDQGQCGRAHRVSEDMHNTILAGFPISLRALDSGGHPSKQDICNWDGEAELSDFSIKGIRKR